MRLSQRILQKLDAPVVRRINEIYHNLENVQYDAQHDDISKFEAAFWRKAAQDHRPAGRPACWLDYGTGTGFVASVVGAYLTPDDTLLCCDVSDEMLKVCRAKLEAQALTCQCAFANIEGTAIPAETGSVDVISVNSVLHHIFDLRAFAAECERVLKPSGLLIVAHEPNRNTRQSFPGGLVRTLATLAFRPKTLLFRTAEWSPASERLMRWATSKVSPRYRQRNRMLADVARQVRAEGLLDFTLRGTEIQQIVDFHSQQGFDRDELCGDIFGGFEIVEFQTYGHLGFFPDGQAAAAIDRYLKRHWPDTGREICFVLRRTLSET